MCVTYVKRPGGGEVDMLQLKHFAKVALFHNTAPDACDLNSPDSGQRYRRRFSVRMTGRHGRERGGVPVGKKALPISAIVTVDSSVARQVSRSSRSSPA